MLDNEFLPKGDFLMSDRKKPGPKKEQDHEPEAHDEAPDNPVPLGPGPSFEPDPDPTPDPPDLPGG
ncbi:hypothetical protein [Mesorhizobium sp. WSM2239]|uniref:Uncharacterized protein n=2 Tax=unclassified Mesorhizobium TaxID=325217 RepID=A0AAU8DJL4_9HYPH